jgi:hypothetical protein
MTLYLKQIRGTSKGIGQPKEEVKTFNMYLRGTRAKKEARGNTNNRLSRLKIDIYSFKSQFLL